MNLRFVKVSSGSAFFAVLFCVLATFEFLNFTKFCYSQGRYLSDEEFLRHGKLAVLTLVKQGDEKRRHYGSLAEFDEANPRCCRILSANNLLPEGTWPRVFGWYVFPVQVYFKLKDDGQVSPSK